MLALVLLLFLSQSFDLERPSNNCSLVVEVPPQRVYYTALELPLENMPLYEVKKYVYDFILLGSLLKVYISNSTWLV